MLHRCNAVSKASNLPPPHSKCYLLARIDSRLAVHSRASSLLSRNHGDAACREGPSESMETQKSYWLQDLQVSGRLHLDNLRKSLDQASYRDLGRLHPHLMAPYG